MKNLAVGVSYRHEGAAIFAVEYDPEKNPKKIPWQVQGLKECFASVESLIEALIGFVADLGDPKEYELRIFSPDQAIASGLQNRVSERDSRFGFFSSKKPVDVLLPPKAFQVHAKGALHDGYLECPKELDLTQLQREVDAMQFNDYFEITESSPIAESFIYALGWLSVLSLGREYHDSSWLSM